MSDKTFAEYKQEMRDFWIQYAKERQGTQDKNSISTNQRDIRTIAEGLYDTFPQQPILGDRLAVCYAYGYLSSLPMPEDDYKKWRKHIKAFVNESPLNKTENDGNLAFMLQCLAVSHGSASENYSYAEKVLRKMTLRSRNNAQVVSLVGKLARPYYEEMVARADKKENFSTYMQQIKAYDKAFSVLLKLPHGSRYREAVLLMEKMKPVYQESEWGRLEWGRKSSSIRNRVFKSLPEEAKQAIRARRAQENWQCK